MTKYLFQGNYVGEGIKGLMQEGGSRRRDAVVTALESVGDRSSPSTTHSARRMSSGSSTSPIRPVRCHCH